MFTRKFTPRLSISILGIIALWLGSTVFHHALMSIRESYAEILPKSTIQFVNAEEVSIPSGVVDNLKDIASEYNVELSAPQGGELAYAFSDEKDTPNCTVVLGIQDEGKDTVTIEYCGDVLPEELQELLNQAVLLGDFYAGTSYTGAVLSYVTMETAGCNAGTYGQPTLPSGWDNKISSFQVYASAGCTWGQLFENTSYGPGNSYVGYPSATSLGGMDNATSSLRIGKGSPYVPFHLQFPIE